MAYNQACLYLNCCLGVGTDTPIRPLHVVGTVPQLRVSYDTYNDPRYSEVSWGGITTYAGNSNNWMTVGMCGGGTPNDTNPNGGIEFQTNNTRRGIITQAGNFSIGAVCANPSPHNGSNALIIQGGGGGRGIIELWDGTSGKSVFQNVSGDTYIGQLCKGSGGGNLYLLTGGTGTSATVSMTVLCAGNVGIGTSSPGSILHVKGGSASGCPFGAELRVWENSFGAVVQGSTIGTTYAFFGNFRYNFNNATGSDAPYSLSAGGMLVKDGIHIFTSNPNASTFTPSERLTIDNSGNVGIGCTAPATALTVAASGANGLLLDQSLSDNTTSARVFFRTNTSGYAMLADASGLNFMTGSAAGSTSGTARMTLSSAGNFGIGTSSPENRLHVTNTGGSLSTLTDVVARINATTNTSGQGSAIALTAISTKETGVILGAEHTSGNNGDFVIKVYNGGATYPERLRITASGNVGIGATSPSAKLHLSGSGDNIMRAESTTTGTVASYYITSVGGVAKRYYAGANTVGVDGAYAITDSTCADAARLYIKSEGSIGIATTTPSYKLHVNGTFYAAGSSVDYKEEVATYDTDSCLFMCLKPVTYQYKDEWKHLGKELKSETQIGLIAEDVAEVMPELAVLVNEEDNKVVRNVDYEKLSIVLLSEVQKLRREVEALKK